MSLFLTDHKLKARTRQATLTTTVQRIVGYSKRRVQIIIINTSSQAAIIGRDSDLTSATGLSIEQNAALTWNKFFLDDCTHEFYGVTAATTADVRIEETFDMI